MKKKLLHATILIGGTVIAVVVTRGVFGISLGIKFSGHFLYKLFNIANTAILAAVLVSLGLKDQPAHA
jgi:hypothetical protein